MRNGLMKRIVTIVAAFAIAFTSPTSSQAILPELIVGGSALLQIGSIVVSSLPQLVAVGTGVLTLMKQGEEIASTVKRIFGIKDDPKTDLAAKVETPTKSLSEGASRTPIRRLDFGASESAGPVTMGERFSEESPLAETAELPSGDLAGLVDGVVQAFYQRMGLEDALRALPEASPERESLQAGYEELESNFENRLSALTNMVVDAAAAGELDKVRGFIEHVNGLEAAGQVAIAPVFAIVLEQGRRFQSLHGGEGDSARAFALLEEAYTAMGG